MTALVHCIYASAATRPPTPDDLNEILESSRRNNQRLGVTGLLLYSAGSFFQVLEGEAAVVDELFRRIAEDPRHDQLVQIVREPIARRAFADWSMGFSGLSAEALSELGGAGDFFEAGGLGKVGAGRARRLLAAFASGRWHRRDLGRAMASSA